MSRKLSIAVTGASGQLGALVVRRLIDDRKVGRIVAIDRVAPSHVSTKLEYLPRDVRDPKIDECFKDCDVVIHLAFIVTHYADDMFDSVNVEGSKNVFRAAVKAGVKKVIYTSSIAAYGVCNGHPDPIVEDTPRKRVADFPYSRAKYDVEAFLDEFEASHPDLAIVRFRPSILIGARFNNPLARLFGSNLDRGRVVGTSGAPMPLVWDGDVADAIKLAYRSDVRGAFNVSADEPMNNADLAKALGFRQVTLPDFVARGLGVVTPLMSKLGLFEAIDPAWQRHSNVKLRQSCEKAKTELGWKPSHPTSLDVMRHYVEVAPGRLDRRIATFMKLAELAAKTQPPDPEMAGMNSVIHLEITGPGGGDYALVIKDRRMRISRGAPRSPKSAARLTAKTFIDLIAGRQAYATAQLTGKIRFEGDTSAGFSLPGLISRFQVTAEGQDLRGRAVSMVHRWIARGGTP